MEDAACGVEGEVLVGRYSCGEPAIRGGPFEGEHVVCGGQRCRVLSSLIHTGECPSKYQFIWRHQFFGCGSLGDRKFLGVDVLELHR